MTTLRPYTTDQKMADLLLSNPRLLTLFERMGLRLGFGERSVEEVCAEQGVSAHLLVAMSNIVDERNSAPSIDRLVRDDLRPIVDFLRLSHHNYTEHYFHPARPYSHYGSSTQHSSERDNQLVL